MAPPPRRGSLIVFREVARQLHAIGHRVPGAAHRTHVLRLRHGVHPAQPCVQQMNAELGHLAYVNTLAEQVQMDRSAALPLDRAEPLQRGPAPPEASPQMFQMTPHERPRKARTASQDRIDARGTLLSV